jgi:hypothetical protein
MSDDFIRDLGEAARSDKYFDKANAEIIANDHGLEPKAVLREIQRERKRLSDLKKDYP